MTLKEITQMTMRAKPLLYKLMDHTSPNLLGPYQASGFLQGSPGARGGGLFVQFAALDDAVNHRMGTVPEDSASA